jgi:hypothetical protein
MLYDTQLGLLLGNTVVLLILMCAGRVIIVMTGYMLDKPNYLQDHHNAFVDGVMRMSGFEVIQRNQGLNGYYRHRWLEIRLDPFKALLWSLWVGNVAALSFVMYFRGPMGLAWSVLGILIFPVVVRLMVRHYRLAKLHQGLIK